ncbi:MAG TPA: tRNA (adenosine(37)-N6)-threonylcarbamoyltransferase complex ATPase subunit type 1 TsaE [Candidatus Saccharibacteria bacterium]|nr:tRNA (adenosine(37)-N6)-threonylcarbamoyltransferase complex ATPase subunit type 1 TsaE [Candidatus Saccharibacteria bacterium]
MTIEVENEIQMIKFGKIIGDFLKGGEIIELIGDIGSGKTTLVKGISEGLRIDDKINSPSFTILRQYPAKNNITLDHYDFYRLNMAGMIMNENLKESLDDKNTVTIIEWSDTIKKLLPADRLKINIIVQPNESRKLLLNSSGPIGDKLIKEVCDAYNA